MAHDLSTIAGRLSYALEVRRITPHSLAQRVGLSHGYVGRLAGGKRASPRPQTIHQLALGLGVRHEWLAFGQGEMDPEDDRLRALGRLTAFDLAVAFLQGSVTDEVVDIAGKWGSEHEQWFLTAREWVAILHDLQNQIMNGVPKRRLQFPRTQNDVPTIRLVTEKIA